MTDQNETKEIRNHMWKKMADNPLVMVGLTESGEHFEPMTAILDKDADSEFWFYTTKTNRLAPGGPAMAHFASKDHKLFACIKGRIVEEKDPAIVDKYWSNMVEAWFEGGRNDPKLMMLRFELDTAEIWEADSSVTGFFKMMTGKTVDSDEVGRHTEAAL
ncbi:pyridoxamine 5'-phosphate oxidase family protein [Stakelama tenebrarum]|uniref:Pyridoxamine 5'-phosphate oxidase family protein n=1 Tax=Stakelama tenebrarum TaxID=2711215 RepID=A0A6G6Y9S6_9SPHN|nr:pyridoxamine 5'-phosphate oxidase family protein [Sphingosinithalassobacter tenebrarum]QIG81326.1 pyridoxamine 5'-phosphate oxidase family protein [Sphingosinithalassobacter tenebrarum]